MFAGRVSELLTLEQTLYQTKQRNPQHFLITGERGIGKSSLLYYLQLIASGGLSTTDDAKFNFITVPVELEPQDDFQSIAKKVAARLNSAVSKVEAFKAYAKTSWDFLKRWEVMGVKYNADDRSPEAHQLMDELSQSIADTVKALKDQVDGCFILMDEADKPKSSADLGAFSKLLTERLMKQDAQNVALGLAGVTGIISKLRESHESAPRVFHNLNLEPLSEEDRISVVQKGLKEATEKNGRPFTITERGAATISSLSEGYPNFIQQFAFCAFDSDTDDSMSYDDVMAGAFKKDGAFHQLGQKYFSELYFDQIGSDEYRVVLRTMAEHSDEWIKKETLKKESKLKPATLNNAITALKKKGIIIPQPGKQGVYKLPNKSFAVWIKAFTGNGLSVASDQKTTKDTETTSETKSTVSDRANRLTDTTKSSE